MYTRENLPSKVALMLGAFKIPREELSDFTIDSINRNDSHGVWEDLRKLAIEHDDTFFKRGEDGLPSPDEYFLNPRNQLSFALNMDK